MKRLVPALMFVLGACGAEASPSGHTHRAPRAEAPAQPYALEVELPTASRAGAPALAKVHVHPSAPWHMNTRFPVELELQAPDGVTLDAARLAKEDAERLDDDALVFAIPFTPKTQGAKRFEGKLSFAMCGELSCDPLTVPVAFTVDVGACDPKIVTC